MPSNVPMRGLRLEDELYLKLRVIAASENRSFNQEAVFILRKFVEEYESTHGEISVDPDELYK